MASELVGTAADKMSLGFREFFASPSNDMRNSLSKFT